MFRKQQSLGLRIWHWLNSAAIFLLLATVILRKTFMSVRGNKTLILEKAQSMGAVLTDPQANDIAKMLRNQMWQWHPIIGFVAIGLLVFRLVVYFKNRSQAVDTKNNPLIYKMVKTTHILFYVVLAIMGITGAAMYWDKILGISESLGHSLQEVHEALLWFFVVFIITHIVGVVKAEFSEDKGLISDMINGGN
jgi:cytochrome b561